MNLVKNYFKIPQDISGVPENIVLSNKIQFYNNTDTYDPTKVMDMLAQFMEKFNQQYMVVNNIPTYTDKSPRIATETSYISEPIPRKAVVTTNKTRKKRSDQINLDIEEEPSNIELSEEEEEEEIPEYNEEEYQLVTDIITTRQTLDTGYIVIPETRYFLSNRPIFPDVDN